VSELNDEVRENEGGEMTDVCRISGFILCTTNPSHPSNRWFTMPRQDGLQHTERIEQIWPIVEYGRPKFQILSHFLF
jgi:hypothetical protein